MNRFEFFETPPAFTRYLFRTVGIHGRLFAPCVGSGAIVRDSGQTGWMTNDIDRRHQADTYNDATSPDCWRGRDIDWTVDNPPFTPAIEIIKLALEHSRVGVAMHLRASIHEVLKTGERRTFMRKYRPTGILWLPRFAYQRSPSTGKWTTDSVCACWVVWMKDPSAPQFIDYAPEWVIDQLDAETKAYRERMDALMAQFEKAERQENEEEVSHPYRARVDSHDEEPIWCADCEYHRDHRIHSQVEKAEAA